MKTITIRAYESNNTEVSENTNLPCPIVDGIQDMPPYLHDRENVNVVLSDYNGDARLYEVRHKNSFGEGMMSPNQVASTIAENPCGYANIHSVFFNRQQQNLAYVFADNDRLLPTLFGEGFLDADEITSSHITLLFNEAVNYPMKKHGSWIRFAEFDAGWTSRLGLVYYPPHENQDWFNFSILTIPRLPTRPIDGLVTPNTLRSLFGAEAVTYETDRRSYAAETGSGRRVFFLGLELRTVHAKCTFVPHEIPSDAEFAVFQAAFEPTIDHPVWTQALEEYGSRFKVTPHLATSQTVKVVCGPLQGTTTTVDVESKGHSLATAFVRGPGQDLRIQIVDIAPSLLRTHLEAMDRVRYETDGEPHIGWVMSQFRYGDRDFVLIRDAESTENIIRPANQLEHAHPSRRIVFVPSM